ncbi:MAG: hypothetical protein ACOC3E_01805 [Cyanobacteriota bacterium]
MLVVFCFGLGSCGDRIETPEPFKPKAESAIPPSGAVSEVAPPSAIQQLRLNLDQYQPQVTILHPQPDEVLSDTTVNLEVQVRDLPIFKNPDLEMGPHLHVILDNQPYRAVYNANQPIVFEDVTPGTHTLRVFASRPWHESFKNEGAYAQTTFHVFTKTGDNAPDPNLPLLTYSRPKGNYGAEPIMLDFYLTNAPLHIVAQESSEDAIADWRIRATINGQSFYLDRWQPIYLKGFKPGKNWVQLEFIDELGNVVDNAFNNTVRLITYEPTGQDTLSKLVRGELSAEAARAIVDPTYSVTPIPTPTPTPIIEPSPEVTPDTGVEETIPPEEVPATEAPEAEKPDAKGGVLQRFRRPKVTPTPEVTEEIKEPEVTQEEETPKVQPEETPTPEVSPIPSAESTIEVPEAEKSDAKGGVLQRFRRPKVTPTPEVTEEIKEPEVTQEEENPTPEVSPVPSAELTPETADTETSEAKEGGLKGLFRRFQGTRTASPSEPEQVTPPLVEPTVRTDVPLPNVVETPSSDLPPTLPEIVEEAPSPQLGEPLETIPELEPPTTSEDNQGSKVTPEASENESEEESMANAKVRVIQPPVDSEIPLRYRKAATTGSENEAPVSETD